MPTKKTTAKVTPIKRKTPAIKYYQFKIMLDECPLPVWRRFLVRSDVPLSLFHEILQVVMGWGNNHLYQFSAKGKTYSLPDEDRQSVLDSNETAISTLASKKGEEIEYVYDLGDSWDHTLVLENIVESNDGSTLARCNMGKRACPPEDVGGPDGYARFLEGIEDPLHDSYMDYLDWIQCDFDAHSFDARLVNMRLELMEDQIINGDVVGV